MNRLSEPTDSEPPWHVWEVEKYFYAAESLESAKKLYCDEWGVELDEVESWDDRHSDNSGFYRTATDWFEIDEDNPDCTMRERAEEMIEEGEKLPFMVGVSLG